MYLTSLPFIASINLEQLQYHAVTIGGTLANDGATAMGYSQNKPAIGEDGTLGFMGRSDYRGGAAISAGNQLTIATSGWTVVAGSGDSVIGRAISNVGSGGIGEGIFNFATPAKLG